MRRLLFLFLIIAVAAMVYSIMSDPDRRTHVFSAIEDSTGVDLGGPLGQSVGRTTAKLFKDLGDHLTDPEFHRALKKWGQNALDKLDQEDLQRLKQDLDREQERPDKDFDALLEKYLGEEDLS